MKGELFFVRGLGGTYTCLWAEGRELSVWLTHTVKAELMENSYSIRKYSEQI